MRTVAWEDGERCTSFEMLPILRYTGQADLSPLKLDSCVLSDASITGAITAPAGIRRYQVITHGQYLTGSDYLYMATHLHLFPPVCRPHLADDGLCSSLVLVHSLRRKAYVFIK